MSYDYQTEKKELFTENGQVAFIKIRDRVKYLLREAGAFRQMEAVKGAAGSSWTIIACLDRMVELGELVKLRDERKCWAQYQIYTSPERDGR